MLINQDGSIDNTVKAALIKDVVVEVSGDQYFQITPSGKRLELWEGKQAYLNYHNPDYDNLDYDKIHDKDCELKKVTGWNFRSVIMFYNITK